MARSRRTVRVDERVLAAVKRYAEGRGRTVAQLVNAFLEVLAADEQALEGTPILQQLTGTLERADARAEHRGYLERKYTD